MVPSQLNSRLGFINPGLTLYSSAPRDSIATARGVPGRPRPNYGCIKWRAEPWQLWKQSRMTTWHTDACCILELLDSTGLNIMLDYVRLIMFDWHPRIREVSSGSPNECFLLAAAAAAVAAARRDSFGSGLEQRDEENSDIIYTIYGFVWK